MTECPVNDTAWLTGMILRMALILILVMTVTGHNVALRQVHSPVFCPHARGKGMLIDKQDKNTIGGLKGWKIKRGGEKEIY